MLEIGFGPMCDPLKDQLERQGLTLSEQDRKRYQDLIWAINLVSLNGLAQDSSCHTMRKRLMKLICGSAKAIR